MIGLQTQDLQSCEAGSNVSFLGYLSAGVSVYVSNVLDNRYKVLGIGHTIEIGYSAFHLPANFGVNAGEVIIK